MADNRMFRDYPDVVTVEQLCNMLGIGRNTAYGLIKQNQIQHIRIGRQIKITKAAVLSFLERDNGMKK